MPISNTPYVENPLKKRLASGELGLCLMIQQCRSVEIALAARSCGFDAINLDLEHSPLSVESASQIAVACLLAGVTPLVRVPHAGSPDLPRMIDAGCLGVILPHVESAAQVRHVVEACRFSPLGSRSVTPNWPQLGYRSYPAAQVRHAINEAMMVVAMIESQEGVERCDEIAATNGVDVIQLGCNDYVESLGIAGQLRDPRVEQAVRAVIDACRRHGKVAGIGGLRTEPGLTERFAQMGVRYIAAGNEWNFMMSAAAASASGLRSIALPA